MSEWRTTTWGAVAVLEYGKALRGYQNGSGGVRVYGTNGPVGWTSVRQAQGPGVVIGRKGAYRGVHYAADDFWVIDTAFYLRPLEPMDLRWAYYALVGLDINAMDSGSAIPSTSRADFYALPVVVPPLRRQRAVAAVLGALDDKIAVNERLVATADEVIRARYTAALYDPASREVPLLEALRITFGAPFASSAFSEQGVGRPLIRIRDLKTHRPQVWTTQSLDKERVVAPGDVVAGMDAEFRPSFWLGAPALLNQRVLHAESRVGGGAALAREALREPLAAVENYKTGTTVAHLNKSDLSTLAVRVPGEAAVAAFAAAAEPLRQRLLAAALESRTLAALRDSLLPRLMSGRLRVEDAEAMVGDGA